MTRVHGMEWDLFRDVHAINRWLERTNPDSPHEDSMRVMKVGEEIGEAYEALGVINAAFGRAVAAYIGMTGQNPRKGVTHNRNDVCLELADVAITALAALDHFAGNPLIAQGFMAAKISGIIARADIPVADLVTDDEGLIPVTEIPPATKPRETGGQSVLDALHTIDTEGL